jgi:hypothetical protein
MTVLLNVFEQILLLGSLIFFTVYVIWHTIHGTNSKELVLRLMALFTGAIIVIGAQIAGVGFATFSVNALSGNQHVTATAKLTNVIIFAAVGVIMGRYITRSFRKDEDIAMRIMGFVSMLAATQFAAIYVIAMGRQGLELGAAALPNISFIAGAFLYVIFTFRTSVRPGTRAPAQVGRRTFPTYSNPPESTPTQSANLFEQATEALYRPPPKIAPPPRHRISGDERQQSGETTGPKIDPC